MRIPDDFPKEPPLAALTGAHPKLAVVFQDGVYKAEDAEEHIARRFDICDDLRQQLVGYSKRKLQERPDWTLDMYLVQLRASLPRKGWGLSPREMDWLVSRVRLELELPNEPSTPAQ